MNQWTTFPAAVQAVLPAALALGSFVSLATLQAPDGVFTPAGAASGKFVDVAGLQNIVCMSSVPASSTIQATEVRALEEITASELHHVILNGYYPQIDQGWRGDGTPTGQWRIVVGDNIAGELTNGFAYQIMGVESDSQNQMTRIKIRLGTV